LSMPCRGVAGVGKVSIAGLGWGSGSIRVSMGWCRAWFQFRVTGVQRAVGSGKLLWISCSSMERLIGVGGTGVSDAGIGVRGTGSWVGGRVSIVEVWLVGLVVVVAASSSVAASAALAPM